jgi:hypothetical protein
MPVTPTLLCRLSSIRKRSIQQAGRERLRAQRDHAANGRARAGSRGNRHFAADQPQALLHAEQSQARCGHDRIAVESPPVVGHFELQIIAGRAQRNPIRRGAGMLDTVGQCLLDDAEDADGNVFRQAVGQVAMRELDGDTVVVRQFAAQARGCRRQAQRLQLRGVQSVRHAVDIPSQRPRLFIKLAEIFAGFDIALWNGLGDPFEIHRQHRNALTHVVV